MPGAEPASEPQPLPSVSKKANLQARETNKRSRSGAELYEDGSRDGRERKEWKKGGAIVCKRRRGTGWSFVATDGVSQWGKLSVAGSGDGTVERAAE
ncbi:hypothetical protein AOLI_G00081880 [Acnodon oligacanthus]